MLDKVDFGLVGSMWQLLKDYSVILLPAAAAFALVLTISRLFGSKASRQLKSDRRPAHGFFPRIADAVTRAFTTNWQLSLLATTAFVLSCASGWTTWDGMRNFTGEPILSGMITFGIQGVMLIIAWLIGESFASGMTSRPGESRMRSTGEWAVGMIVGILFATSLLVAIANAFGAFDLRAASSGNLSLSSIADKALYLAVGLLLIATLLLNNKSDVAQPYVQSVRIMARNAVLWVMFLACMATSVFFSFDSLFTAIFPQSERTRAAEIRAVNQVAGVVADIGALTQRRQVEEADRLFQSDGWKRYEDQLLRLSRESQGAEQLIEAYFVQQMEGRRRAIAEQQERVSSSHAGQAGLVAKKATLTDELSRLKAERPALAGELAKVKSELDERARTLDAKRVEAMAEERGAEGTLKAGKGPVYRERVAELARMQDAYKIQEERVRDAQKRLAAVDQRVVQLERELAAVDGDIAKLRGEAETAEARIKATEQQRTGDDGPKVDPARVRNAFERARTEFRQEPTVERLNALTQQCTQLYNALAATPATKEKVRAIDCDPKPATEAAARVFALNSGLESFARNCAGGDKLPQSGSTDALLTFGRKCLQDSGLPSKDSGDMAARISAIDLNRDDKAHRFVVTWNAFLDGNRLAYLALAIAIAIDSLVFMSGLFGANAVRSPLSAIEHRGDMTADQLDATINGVLKQSPHPRQLLNAIMGSLHPIHGDSGFTSEINLDELDSIAEEIRQVLNVARTIGAVRPVGNTRARYQLHSGLVRYLAIALDKAPKFSGDDVNRKELVNVIGVALLPDPQAHAEIVLSELHPISDAPGYAAETYPAKIEDPAHLRLVRNVLGAGATIPGAVQRDQDRYFVSIDLYKTLLMMRAAAIPAFRLDNLQQRLGSHNPAPQALRSEPTLTLGHARGDSHRSPSSHTTSNTGLKPPAPPHIMPDAGPPPLPPQSARPATPVARSPGELETSLGNTIRNEIIQIGGLFPWDARDIAIARIVGSSSETEKALKRLQSRAPRLAGLVGDAIDDYRTGVRSAYDELAAYHAHDSVYLQVLETVSGELETLMPLLILSPGGPYQQILERLIYDLEPQDAEGALSPNDRQVLAAARGQVSALKSLADARPDRLQQVAWIVDSYDERIPASPQVPPGSHHTRSTHH